MISQRAELSVVAFSVKMYEALLVVYPTKFQQEYGSEMLQVFQDCCLRAFRQNGTNGMIKLWALTLLDLFRSVISEHLHKEADMSKSQLIKFSGWAFILGSFAFITILEGSDAVAIPGSEISAILLAVGLLGLRARYGERVGSFGRNILLLGASGPILLVIVIVMGLFGILTETQISRGLWTLLFGGPAITLLGLTLFGLAALRSKPMSRLNWLPVLGGIWYPLVYFFSTGYIFTHHGVFPDRYFPRIEFVLLIQFFVLCVFGTILVADTPQEMTT